MASCNSTLLQINSTIEIVNSSWRVLASTENAPEYNAIQLNYEKYKNLVASYKRQVNLKQLFIMKLN